MENNMTSKNIAMLKGISLRRLIRNQENTFKGPRKDGIPPLPRGGTGPFYIPMYGVGNI